MQRRTSLPTGHRSSYRRWPRGVVARLLFVALLTSIAAATMHPGAPAAAADCDAADRNVVQASDLVTKLAAGQPVFLSCVTVRGPLELRADMGEVGPLYIIESVIEDGFSAPFVRFKGAVHFDGSCFGDDVDIQGAVFEDELNWTRASFGCDGKPVTIFASVSRFHGAADLRAEVYHGVDFSDAAFGSRTLVQGTLFEGEASFRGALFEDDASFRGAIFSGFADFENVSALADVDLSGTEFHDDARFRRFASPSRLSLRDANFTGELSLDRASVATVDLTRADFRGALRMADLAAGTLQMTPSLVSHIEDDATRVDVLRLIERSAKAQDDTSLANAALFQRERIATRAKPQPDKTLWLGIEATTGYLVRPIRPLVAMIVVAFIGFGVRLFMDRRDVAAGLKRAVGASATTVARRSSKPAEPDAPPERSSWHIVALLAAPAGHAITAAIDPHPPKPEIDETDGSSYAVATLAWLEYLVQKTFVVVFLISLGNANPTIREIITSIL